MNKILISTSTWNNTVVTIFLNTNEYFLPKSLEKHLSINKKIITFAILE